MDTLERSLRQLKPDATDPDVVCLQGDAPANMHHDGLGLFEKRKEKIGGSPSYSLIGDDETVLWRASDSNSNLTQKSWFIGKLKNAGTTKGELRARDGAPSELQQRLLFFPEPVRETQIAHSRMPIANYSMARLLFRVAAPEAVKAAWEFQRAAEIADAASGDWVQAPGVRCVAGAALEMESENAALMIALVGSTPEDQQRDCLGLFERTKERVNGYPCFALVGSDGSDLLWHAGSCWIVGNKPDCGSKVGGLLVYDGSLRPEATRGTWEVMGSKNEWVPAPGVRCICGAALEFELQSSAMTVALVGTTPRDLQSAFVGIFERLPNLVNGLSTYKSKGSSSTLMWHAGCYWNVGSFSGKGGQMRAADGALRPEMVTATWEVYDGRQRKWVEAPDLRCMAKHRIVRAVEEVKAVEAKAERRLRRTVSAIGRLEKQGRRPIR